MTLSVYVHPTAILEDGAEVGEGTKIWHFAHVRKGAKIGKNCVIGKGVFIDADVEVGDNCKIQNNVSVYHGVTIGNGVFVGPHVCFTNDKLPRAVKPDGSLRSATEWTLARTKIEDGVSIGANSTIVAGITVGTWCMVAAGSVVTKSVPPHALVMGNPARPKGVVSKGGEILAREYKAGSYANEDNSETLTIK